MLERDGHCCRVCRAEDRLAVHHREPEEQCAEDVDYGLLPLPCTPASLGGAADVAPGAVAAPVAGSASGATGAAAVRLGRRRTEPRVSEALVPAAPENPRNTEFEPLARLVLDAVSSPHTKRAYATALHSYFAWHSTAGVAGFTRANVQAYRSYLEAQGLAASSINVYLSAVRKLAEEAGEGGWLAPETAASITRVAGVRQHGARSGNWLTPEQATALLRAPDRTTRKGVRDRAILALLLGCGLRRAELAKLSFEHLQLREGRWVLVDLVGKGKRFRTAPVPAWTKVSAGRMDSRGRPHERGRLSASEEGRESGGRGDQR